MSLGAGLDSRDEPAKECRKGGRKAAASEILSQFEHELQGIEGTADPK